MEGASSSSTAAVDCRGNAGVTFEDFLGKSDDSEGMFPDSLSTSGLFLTSGLCSIQNLENYMASRIPMNSALLRLRAQMMISEIFFAVVQDEEANAYLSVLRGFLSEERAGDWNREELETHRAIIGTISSTVVISKASAAAITTDLETKVAAIIDAGDTYGEAMFKLGFGEISMHYGTTFSAAHPDKTNICSMYSSSAALLFELANDLLFAGVAWLVTGLNAFSEDNPVLTAKSACKALDNFSSVGDSGACVHGLNLLSGAYLLRNNFAQSLATALQALEIARSLGNEMMIDVLLDHVTLIEESHETICGHETHDAEGLWTRRTPKGGEEEIVIQGESVIWTNGDAPSSLTRTYGSNELILESMGRKFIGELLNSNHGDAKIEWEDDETWSLKCRCNRTAIIPDSFRIQQPSGVQNPRSAICALREAFNISHDDIRGSSLVPFLDLQISSLGLNSTQMFMARELMGRHFGVSLPIHCFLEFETIGDVVAYILGYMNPSDDEAASEDDYEYVD